MARENFAMHERLLSMAWTNDKTSFAYLSVAEHSAYLVESISKVSFRWSPNTDTVWISYFPESERRTGHPWMMEKEEARQLWEDMVKAGWECPDGGVGHAG